MDWHSQITLQGVGTKLIYKQKFNFMNKNASPRDSLGLLTKLRRRKKKEGLIAKPLEAFLECCEAQSGQHFPLI